MNSPYIRNRLFEGWNCFGSSSRHTRQFKHQPQADATTTTTTTNRRHTVTPGRGCGSSGDAPTSTITSSTTITTTTTIPKETNSKGPLIEPVVESSSSPSSASFVRRAASLNPQCNTSMTAESELRGLLDQLHNILRSRHYNTAPSLLSKAKVCLLHLNALLPSPQTPKQHLQLARDTLEMGALMSIRLQDPDSFTRYFQQLQPFYALPASQLPAQGGNSSKITGLYLLLLLSQGDYAGFHTLLEKLELAAAQAGKGLEEDEFIQYPVRLEQALMEGSYDRVWGETKGERVPGEEFAVFSEVLIGTIRAEIASCSEKAYASIPISNAKNLFFLESEGAVVQFSQQRGWVVRDGRVYFPRQDQDLLASEKDILTTTGQVIENTLGYARELETIV